MICIIAFKCPLLIDNSTKTRIRGYTNPKAFYQQLCCNFINCSLAYDELTGESIKRTSNQPNCFMSCLLLLLSLLFILFQSIWVLRRKPDRPLFKRPGHLQKRLDWFENLGRQGQTRYCYCTRYQSFHVAFKCFHRR